MLIQKFVAISYTHLEELQMSTAARSAVIVQHVPGVAQTSVATTEVVAGLRTVAVIMLAFVDV